jgi:hypothetical protein
MTMRTRLTAYRPDRLTALGSESDQKLMDNVRWDLTMLLEMPWIDDAALLEDNENPLDYYADMFAQLAGADTQGFELPYATPSPSSVPLPLPGGGVIEWPGGIAFVEQELTR